MQPLISLRVGDARRVWRPGEQLEIEYQIDAVDAQELLAVEASVLWYTEGKGDEDLSVLYFERRTPGDSARATGNGPASLQDGATPNGATPNGATANSATDDDSGDLRSLRKVAVTLPNSPLSYQGAIVKLRWCARVRVFLRGGKETFFEAPFQLGVVPPALVVTPPPSYTAEGDQSSAESGASAESEPAPAKEVAVDKRPEVGAETWLVGSESRLASDEGRPPSRLFSNRNGRAAGESGERGEPGGKRSEKEAGAE